MPTAQKKSKKHKTPNTPEIDLHDESLYLNRELSWIEFNARVLEEAEDKSHPLLERLKFLTIFETNLDEFFMIRVAGLMEQRDAGVTESSPDGMSPTEQLKEIRSRLIPLFKHQAKTFYNDVMPSLEKEGIRILQYKSLTIDEKEELRIDFVDNMMPVLTPLALDPGHPFPRLLNRSLTIAFVLFDDVDGEEEMRIAVLQLPAALSRLFKMQRSSGIDYIPMEEVIQAHAEILFPGLRVHDTHVFRVTRDADVEIAEDEANDLMTAVAEGIRQRRWGTDAVRMEVSTDMPRALQNVLMRSLDLSPADVYQMETPLNLQDYMELMKLERRRLKDAPFTSRVLPEFANDASNIFEALKEGDLLVHHPFDSFTNSVVKFITAAADDPHVLAIKITLYRAGGKSPVIEALKRAAGNGKSVTVFLELKARFDEENNIAWARSLENSGVHVVYGVMGLKVHCKVCLVVRREGKSVLTYAHIGTGNYNLATSRVYTDVGIFTGRQEFERDFVHLFNLLTGYSKHAQWEHIGVAPVNLREKFIDLIQREVNHVANGGKGHIVAKLNSVNDPAIIRELYKASMAGVKIELIVRGMCSLRPGVPGISNNITVRSIIDRFLEHSRIYWFANGEESEVFISSADWMTRNLDRRVELLFPVREARIKKRLKDVLDLCLTPSSHTRILTSEGTYRRDKESGSHAHFRVQMALLHGIKK